MVSRKLTDEQKKAIAPKIIELKDVDKVFWNDISVQFGISTALTIKIYKEYKYSNVRKLILFAT